MINVFNRYTEILTAPSLTKEIYIHLSNADRYEVYLRMMPVPPELHYLGELKKTDYGEWTINGSDGKSKLGAIRGAIGKLIRNHGGI